VTSAPGVRRVVVGVGVVLALALVAVVVVFALLRFSPLWGAIGMFEDGRRAEAFRTMDTIFPAQRIAPGDDPWLFTVDLRPLPAAYIFAGEERSIAAFLEATETTGLLVARDGVIVHESYHRGYDASARIASFSVAKPFVTVLVGIAVERGHIASIDDPLDRYVPELAAGGYAGVSIRQALTMTSGIAFDEAYDDARSDVMGLPIQVYGLRRSVPALLSRLERARPPGLERAYASSDALVLGMVVSRAVGTPLAAFLEEALWGPAGMASDATWNTDLHDHALAHAFLNATLRDYARFGRLVLHGGARDGRQVVPAAWIDDALRATDSPRSATGAQPFGADFGFGYHWWLPDATEDDAVAIGIYGQYLYVHRGHGVVIVKTSTDAGFAGREAETVEVLRAIARWAAGD
jgi:CubicO group peptidase (beta-lactamase class C family)